MTSADRAFDGEADLWRDELADALRDARGLVPDEDVVWERFHRRLNWRAALSLARLRSRGHALSITVAARAATSALAVVFRRLHERGP